MSDSKVTPSHYYRHWNGMCWPAPGEALQDLQWCARYSDAFLAKRLVAASVIDAYVELISMSAKRRNEIVRELRKGPGIVK